MNRADRSLIIRMSGRLLAAGLVLSLALGAREAQASFGFITPSGSMAGGQPVNAMATFTISAGVVQVTITNNEVDPTSDSQTVNGVSFTLSSGQTVGSISSKSGQLINIAGNGSFSTTGGNPNWAYGQSGLGVEISSLLASNGGGSPTIIGPAGSGGIYSGNASITNGAHNPFVQDTATFTLAIAGVPANATITAMRFEFGTESGSNVTGIPFSTIPEPASVVMLSAGIGAIGLVSLRRRASRVAA